MRMPDPNKGIRTEMYLRLMEKGLTAEGWGRSQGLPRGLMAATISRYVGGKERPTGWRAKAIIEGLEAVTGLKLCG